MKRLVYFEYIHHFGGAQRSTIDFIKNLQILGYEVTFIDAEGTNLQFEDAIKLNGINLVKFKGNSKVLSNFKSLDYIFKIFKLMRILLSIKPNICISNSKKALLTLLMCRILCKFNTYYFIRGIIDGKSEKLIWILLIRIFVNKIFVQSQKIKKHVSDSLNRKDSIFVINNVIPPVVKKSEILACEEVSLYKNSFRIVTVGTIIKEKGYIELIKACDCLTRANIDYKMFIVGDFIKEDFKQELHHLISYYELGNSVIFLGYRNDVLSIIKSCNLFVLPSHNEGTPRSLLEAMAIGVLSLATSVGGIPDIIKDNETGFLVEPRSSVALHEKIKYIIDNFQKLRQIEVNAENSILLQYTNDQQIKNIKKFF